jgi:hypothetical protein
MITTAIVLYLLLFLVVVLNRLSIGSLENKLYGDGKLIHRCNHTAQRVNDLYDKED